MEFTLVDKCVNLVAKRNSGKSILLKWLVSQQKDEFDKIFCVCPTEKVAPFYRDFVPENCVFDNYSEQWTMKLIEQMTKSKADNKKRKVLLIFDDITTDVNLAQSKSFKILYSRGRHLGISVIITQQFLHSLPPICRTNCDYCLVGQMNQASVEILADSYLSGGLNRQEFYQLYNDNTKDYNFLIINNNSSKHNSPTEIYGSIKTPHGFVD